MVNSSSGLRTVDALFEDEDFLEASFEGVDVEAVLQERTQRLKEQLEFEQISLT
jgi:hypothetical protein